MSEEKTCKTCHFWDRLKERWDGAFADCDDGPLEFLGACMRYPPQKTGKIETTYLAITTDKGEDTGEKTEVTYDGTDCVVTNDHDWCGEHKSREPTQRTE